MTAPRLTPEREAAIRAFRHLLGDHAPETCECDRHVLLRALDAERARLGEMLVATKAHRDAEYALHRGRADKEIDVRDMIRLEAEAKAAWIIFCRVLDHLAVRSAAPFCARCGYVAAMHGPASQEAGAEVCAAFVDPAPAEGRP